MRRGSRSRVAACEALRRLTCALTAAIALLGTAPASAVEEFEPSAVPMKAEQVAPHTWYVLGQTGLVSRANEGFNANAGFVVTTDGVVVFDALGTPALGKRFADLISATTPQPIRKVVVSHYHADHFYGLQALKAPGVEVWAHAVVRDYLASEAPAARLLERRESLAPWVNEKTRVVAPDRYVGDDTVFKLGGLTFRVLHAGPAHTPEDLMMLVEEDGVPFVGDLMFSGRIPFVGDAQVASWIAAIERVIALRPRVVVGGHGPASLRAVDDLALTRDYLIYLRSQITSAFEEALDFEAAYRRIDWSRYAALPAFAAANRRNAYQTYLNVEQEALQAVKTPARRP